VDEGEHRQRFDIWSATWSAAAVLALLGLVVPGYILDRLWLADTWWLAPVVPLVLLPILIIPLTSSRRPSGVAAVAALVASASCVALGLGMQRLLVWAATLDGSWYTGPGSLYHLRPRWHTYETLALAYAGLAALVLVLLLSALALAHRRTAQRDGGSHSPSTTDHVASV
jgi:membrane glycosyltransferase